MNLTATINPRGFDLRFFGRTLFAGGARKGPHTARTTDHACWRAPTVARFWRAKVD